MKDETWIPIVGYEGLYEVSNKGRVRSLDTVQTRSNGKCICRFKIKGRIPKPFRTGKNDGYDTVQLSGRENRKVHRLVAEAFLDNPLGLPEVNHIDGNKRNNAVENLEWVTGQENVEHAVRMGLMKSGDDVPIRKLSSRDVAEIRAAYKPGIRGSGVKSLAKRYGVSSTTMRNILSGRKWGHVQQEG